MKTKYYFLILLLLLTLQLFTQTWDVYIGDTELSEAGIEVMETYDKGYLYLSYQEGEKTLLTKTDINGEVLWQKTFVIDGTYYPFRFIETSDNGYILIGNTYPYGKSDIYIIKFNICFEQEWARIIHDDIYDLISYQVLENEENTILINTRADKDMESKVSLFAMSLEGDLLWRKDYVTQDNYPDINNQRIFNIKQINGNYYGSGFCSIPLTGVPNTYILKPLIIAIDSNFEEKWIQLCGDDNLRGFVYSISCFDNDTLFSAGRVRLNNQNNGPLIAMLDIEGNKLGYYSIESDSISNTNKSGVISKVDLLEDGKLISGGGFNDSNDPYNTYVGYLVFDTLGNVYEYEKKTEIKSPNEIKIISDGKYLESGTYKPENGDWDAYFTKFNKDLEPDTLYTQTFDYDYLCPDVIETEEVALDNFIVVGVEDLPAPKEYYFNNSNVKIKVYPNPASDIVHFTLTNVKQPSKLLLQVYDLQSRPLFQTTIAKGQTTVQTDLSLWSSGMYAVVLTANGRVVGMEKFVVR